MIVEPRIFTCSICGEPSSDICAYCTKDACANHRCTRCKRCSDCCECDQPLSANDREPEPAPEHSVASANNGVPYAVTEPAPATAAETATEGNPPAPSEPAIEPSMLPETSIVPPPSELSALVNEAEPGEQTPSSPSEAADDPEQQS